MVGGISQFYSTKLYEQFKYKFTGEESFNLWAYDYDFQISNFMNNNNKQYICIEKSIVQHIGIKTSMIRNNNKLKNKQKIDIFEHDEYKSDLYSLGLIFLQIILQNLGLEWKYIQKNLADPTKAIKEVTERNININKYLIDREN